MKAPIANLADFAALGPFFRIIEQGLDGVAGRIATCRSVQRTSVSSPAVESKGRCIKATSACPSHSNCRCSWESHRSKSTAMAPGSLA